MPIILDGTTGITTPGITNTGTFVFQGPVQVPAGTVGAPSVTTDNDTNTGIYFPAADTIGFAEGGVEALRINSSAQIAVNTAGTAGAPVITKTDDLNTGIFFPAADTIAFSEGGVEAMRLDSAGNVGIGTTSPGQRLEVAGNIFINTSGNPYIEVKTSGAGNNPYLKLTADTNNWIVQGTFSNTNDELMFQYNSSTLMTLDKSGNLGIGTTSPATTVAIAGSTATTLGFSISPNGWNNARHRLTVPISGDTSVWSFNYNGSAIDSSLYATSQVIVGNGVVTFGTGGTNTAPSERARITSGGTLLVGNTSVNAYGGQTPVAEFYGPTITSSDPDGGNVAILGTSIVAGGGGSLVFGSRFITNSSYGTWARIRGPKNNATSGDYGGYLAFDTRSNESNFAERARITSNGNLLVATTSDTDNVRFRVDGANSTWGTGAFYNGNKGVNVSHIHYGGNGDWYIRPANASGTVYVLNYAAESDQRLKKDITDIEYGLAEIMNFKPRKFRWKEGDGRLVNGFVAQEVEQIVPSIISEGQWKAVDYNGMTAILVKAIQELKAELDALKGSN